MTKEKAKTKDWLHQNMLKVAVLGDENFAFRLRAFIGSHDFFSCFDAEALMSANYRPNTLVVTGPLSGKIKGQIAFYKRASSPIIVYVESVIGEAQAQKARETADELSAQACVIKEFVEVKDVAETLKEIASV